MKQHYLVEIMPGMRIDCRGEESIGISLGDSVVIKFEKYTDCGLVIGMGKENAGGRSRGTEGGHDKRSGRAEKPAEIIRKMTDADFQKADANDNRAASMFKTAQRKVHEHHLVMKLINCHYSLDKTIVFFQFSAEGRVDFRGLVKDLSGALHTRIELRQIGVRDEAGIIGGIGVCGQPFCCARFLTRFYSVNVKMAKIQRLSLNPANVSGGCGRLKCCLRYEVDGYKEMCRGLPRTGSRCETPEGCGRVMDCNALTQKVRVRLDSGSAQFQDFEVADVKPASQQPGGDEKAGRKDKKNAPRSGRSPKTDDRKKRQTKRNDPGGKSGERQTNGKDKPAVEAQGKRPRPTPSDERSRQSGRAGKDPAAANGEGNV